MIRSNTLASIIAFAAWSAALPATTESSIVQKREPTDCASGTTYYKCVDYDGCFASNPCTTPLNQSICVNGSTSKEQRTMYVVLPSDPQSKAPGVSYFQVVSGGPDIDQVGVFKGIPAGARSCSLYWKQADADERVFKVTGNGRVSAIQYDNFDTGNGISWSDVENAKAISAEFGPDMSAWDRPNYPAWDHGFWTLTCAETIYMKFETHKGAENQGVNDYRNVYMDQDDKNGWYIRYKC